MIHRAQVLFLLVLCCGLQMRAQWNPAATSAFGAAMGSTALMTGNLSLGRMTLEGSTNSRAATGKAAQASKELVFQTYSAVSATLRQQFEQIVLSQALPGKRGAAQQELAKFEPFRVFNANLTKSGFSPYDMANQ